MSIAVCPHRGAELHKWRRKRKQKLMFGHFSRLGEKNMDLFFKKIMPFTDGEYIKDAFLSSAQVLFDGLPNKETIKSRIRDNVKTLPNLSLSILRSEGLMSENFFQ